jgi:hypothetical protein
MIATRVLVFLLPFAFFLLPSISLPTLAQSQTTGRIVGTVKDENGAVIAGAGVTVVSRATGENRTVYTNDEGNYAVPLLPPGTYRVTINANGFKKADSDSVRIAITETTPLNVDLEVGSIEEQSGTISAGPPLAQRDGPQLGRVVDSRGVSELPLATRNFTQILALSPGVVLALIDSTAVGSNSQSVSVNGARVSQNNYQINGVDANNFVTNNALYLAVPAPETIQEFKVQTSLYDATFGHSAGGNVQAVTKSGGHDFHGGAYEYFRDDVLNANNPFLKAAGVKRPVLKRNVFGGALGGPIKKEKAFFFISYQGIRERNGASSSSLSSNIQVAQGLTDDRSKPTLLKTFNATSVDPVALALLNAKLPNGQYLIPTPQADGTYSGSAPSRYREDQFNTNFDYLINERNWFAAKLFFANAPQTLALNEGANSANVPGFGAEQQNNNRLLSLQEIHAFSPRVINEARLGYNFIRGVSFPREPVKDSDIGIQRSTANAYPGLPLIAIGANAKGVTIGTSSGVIDRQFTAPSTTFVDILSITRGEHSLRVGAEAIYYQTNFTRPFFTYGTINFKGFNEFLSGAANFSSLGNGIPDRALRTTDYSFFIQDDWRLSSGLTLNFGLRYELDLPPSDTRGRLSTFDPSLYKPRSQLVNGVPTGLPIGGFVQAGNVIAQYELPEIPKVSQSLLRSVDPNNFAPRVGFAYSPLHSGRVVVRGGYGLYYSRIAAATILNSLNAPPYYVVARTQQQSVQLAAPFPTLDSQDRFPLFVPGIQLSTQVFDRNMRTPYLHEYNLSLQSSLGNDMTLEVAYVGTRGLNQQRLVAINQPRLASPEHPIINEVTQELITTNTLKNAAPRAPFQGAAPNGFLQNQQTAQSSYNALQASLIRRLSHGLQLLTSYTYAKSMDNASEGPFGQAGAGNVGDVSRIRGDQHDNRANRGVSDFDRTHRLVISGIWDLPSPAFAAGSTTARRLLSNWQVAGIVVAMSGLPIDIVDSGAGSFYGFSDGAETLTRPNWAAGASRGTATTNIPAGYFFNPFAFARPVVNAGQPIPSSKGTAIAGERGSDIGSLGRNVLRGPKQSNVDFSAIKRFRIDESKNIEFRAEFFNLLNQVNLANPISNFNSIASSGGRIGKKTGRVISPGNFGRIISTSNNPRIIQFALKFNY